MKECNVKIELYYVNIFEMVHTCTEGIYPAYINIGNDTLSVSLVNRLRDFPYIIFSFLRIINE